MLLTLLLPAALAVAACVPVVNRGAAAAPHHAAWFRRPPRWALLLALSLVGCLGVDRATATDAGTTSACGPAPQQPDFATQTAPNDLTCLGTPDWTGLQAWMAAVEQWEICLDNDGSLSGVRS